MEVNRLLELIHRKGNKILEWHMTCFLNTEMRQYGPWRNRMSTWIVLFYSSLEACMLYPWIFRGGRTHMSLGIVDIYDFLRSPLGSHEDMISMSDDWS